MRKNLYKGKRKDNGEWAEGYFAVIPIGSLNGIREPMYIIISNLPDVGMIYDEIIPETVCQYIEQNDSGGKKIFEGDIVTINAYGIDAKENRCGVVSWDNEASMFVIKSKNNLKMSFQHVSCHQCEVIGNVFDAQN